MDQSKPIDLGVRTFDFSKKLIKFLKILPKDTHSQALSLQLFRSGTSVGANYREANGAESKKDFLHKIGICKKEAKETLYWLGLLYEAMDVRDEECTWLINECQELVKIFGKISTG